MPELLRKDGLDLPHTPAIDMREYIYDMPLEMAAADVVISRSGAATCNEIAASGTPSILIPSPNVTNNHQERNARVLSDKNAAVTILEKDCTCASMDCWPSAAPAARWPEEPSAISPPTNWARRWPRPR